MNPDTDPNNTPEVDGTTPTPTPAPDATPVVEATPTPTPTLDAEPVIEATPSPVPATEATPVTAVDTPTPDPLTPADQAVPAAAPFAVAGAPEPKKSNTKKIILIASIAGGVIILGIIAAILFVVLTTVSKQDYRDAAVQFNDVSRASSSLTLSASTLGRSASGSTTDATFQESLKTSEEAIATVKTENEELSKLKAVRVGEGAELYKAFNDKLKAYLAYGDGLVASVENIRPAMVICDEVGDASDATARVAALKACSSALGDVKELPNEDFKKFVDTMKTAYADYATTYEKISALTNPYGAQYEEYKTLRDSMYDTQDKISAASKEFSSALTASDDEFSVKETADALGKYLTEQQR